MTTFALFPTNSNITRRMNSDRDIAAELQTPLREGVANSAERRCLFNVKNDDDDEKR